MRNAESYTDRVLRLFAEQPGTWFTAYELSKIGGFAAWRTRTSEARTILEARGAGTIENKVVRAKNAPTVSLYRFVPATAEPQRGLPW